MSARDGRGSVGIGGLLGALALLAGVVTARSIVRGLVGWLRGSPAERRAHVDPASLRAGHELREVSATGVVTTGVVVALLIGMSVVVATWFTAGYAERPLSLTSPPGLATPIAPPAPPEPRLEEIPGDQLQQVRASEDQLLNSSGWVDRQSGVARIPIDRAMDLIVQQGLPARSPAEASGFNNDGVSAPSAASSGRVPERRQP